MGESGKCKPPSSRWLGGLAVIGKPGGWHMPEATHKTVTTVFFTGDPILASWEEENTLMVTRIFLLNPFLRGPGVSAWIC